ncbi:MAG TPA: hypothetical protein VK211_26365 [Kamptonema sp.]|nr:hypothetical protein [Kamptonema sp.]
MERQLQIVLSEDTLKLIDEFTKTSGSLPETLRERSHFIDEAVKFYITEKQRENLKQQVKEGALRRAKRDLGLAEEWLDLEEEAWLEQ